MAISGVSFTINFGRAYATKGLTRPTGNRTAERTDRETGRPTEPTAESAAAAACTGPSSISAALWASIVACLPASCQAAGCSLRAAALWATTTGAANCQLATVNNFAYLNIYWWRKRLVALLTEQDVDWEWVGRLAYRPCGAKMLSCKWRLILPIFTRC